MKASTIVMAAALAAGTAFAGEAKCIWEFGKAPIPAEDVTGDLKVSGTSFFLDGSNQLRLPKGILPTGDYTVEFELKTTDRRKLNLLICTMQDCDYMDNPFRLKCDKGWGLGFWGYGAGMLYYNHGQVEMSQNVGTCPIPWGQDNKYIKQTFMMKGKRLNYFRDGLILMCTEDLRARNDAETVFRFGHLLGKDAAHPAPLAVPLEVRNLKIYDAARFPTGYDPTISRRMNVNGAEFNVYMEPREGKNADKKRILVVGDSISMHYRGLIAERFKDVATTDYWFGGCWFGQDACDPEPGQPLSKPEIAWKGIADRIGQYDVITFNPMTLHWWNSKFAVRCDKSYVQKNVRYFLAMMKKYQPKAKIVWIRCTPVREFSDTETPKLDTVETPRIRELNALCDEVVKEEGLASVDLFTISLNYLEATKGWKDAVHWKDDAGKAFAEAIIPEVEKGLK